MKENLLKRAREELKNGVDLECPINPTPSKKKLGQ